MNCNIVANKEEKEEKKVWVEYIFIMRTVSHVY